MNNTTNTKNLNKDEVSSVEVIEENIMLENSKATIVENPQIEVVSQPSTARTSHPRGRKLFVKVENKSPTGVTDPIDLIELEKEKIDLEFIKKEYSREKSRKYDLVDNYDNWDVPQDLFVPIKQFSLKQFLLGTAGMAGCRIVDWNFKPLVMSLHYCTGVVGVISHHTSLQVRNFVASGYLSMSWGFLKGCFRSLPSLWSEVPKRVLKHATLETELVLDEVVNSVERAYAPPPEPTFWESLLLFFKKPETVAPPVLNWKEVTLSTGSVPYVLGQLAFWGIFGVSLALLYKSMPRSLTIEFSKKEEEIVRDLRTDDLSLMNIRHNNPKLMKCKQRASCFQALDYTLSQDFEGDRDYIISYELLSQIAGPSNFNLVANHEEVVKKMCHQASRMNSINFDRYAHLLTQVYPNTQWVAKCWHWNYKTMVSPAISGF